MCLGHLGPVVDDLGGHVALVGWTLEVLGVLLLVCIFAGAWILYFLSFVEVGLVRSLRWILPVLLGSCAVALEDAADAGLASHEYVGFGGAIALHQLVLALGLRASGRRVLVRILVLLLLVLRRRVQLLVFLYEISTIGGTALSSGEEAAVLASAAARNVFYLPGRLE